MLIPASDACLARNEPGQFIERLSMKLDKDSYIYGETEVIANQIRGKRNLAQKDTATIALKVVLNEVMDEISKGTTIEQLMEDGKKDWRIKVRNEIQPLCTAAKNYQSTHCFDSGLLPKATAADSSEEFV